MSATARARSFAAERAGVGGLAFDALYAALVLWFLGGIYLDGWAHNHFGGLETFFTPWHAALYSGYGATAVALAGAVLVNRSREVTWRAAVPVGYGLAAVGAVVFAAAGAADMVWHQLFGIEVGLEPLLSPTHLALATGGGLMATGPLRAGWARNDPRGLARMPQLVSLLALLSLFTFMTQFAHPYSQTFAFEAARTPSNADVYVMAADGSRQTRLTTEGRVASAAWSPDGARLVLTVSERGKPPRVFLANTEGGDRRSLLDAPATLAAWSPEGGSRCCCSVTVGATWPCSRREAVSRGSSPQASGRSSQRGRPMASASPTSPGAKAPRTSMRWARTARARRGSRIIPRGI